MEKAVIQNSLLFLFVFFFLTTRAQKTVNGKVLSLVDTQGVSGLFIEIGKGQIIKADARGFFSCKTKKKRMRLSSIKHAYYGFDTVLNLKTVKDTVIMYAIRSIDSKTAKYDIKRNKITLFCLTSSFTRVPEKPEDFEFEKTYNVQYDIVGDLLPGTPEQMASYNIAIFEFLDKKYGKVWRKYIRKDVVGIEKSG